MKGSGLTMRAGILVATLGIIGIVIVNSVRTSVSTAGWSTGEISLTALFGLLIAAGVVMSLVGSFSRS